MLNVSVNSTLKILANTWAALSVQASAQVNSVNISVKSFVTWGSVKNELNCETYAQVSVRTQAILPNKSLRKSFR